MSSRPWVRDDAPISAHPAPWKPDPADIAGLLGFAADVTESLRLDDGRYCYDRDWFSGERRGQSTRYTLIVALGFQRAERFDYVLPRTSREVLDAAMARTDELSLGDRGLAVWALVRAADARAEALARELDNIPVAVLGQLEGMELAWLVLGAVAALEVGIEASEPRLSRLLASLRQRRSRRSPLLRHQALGRARSRLPNFASQVYGLLALSEAARATGDASCLDEAVALADALVELRLPDGGWPWLYDADRAVVVEDLQMYSVHQDAMAPLAYFALAEATGDVRYGDAGADGLAWCFGDNPLGFCFYEPANRFAHRAIRRPGWAARTELGLNTAAALCGRRRRVALGGLEVNATCRPYHLGWILEAWAGREHHGRCLIEDSR